MSTINSESSAVGTEESLEYPQAALDPDSSGKTPHGEAGSFTASLESIAHTFIAGIPALVREMATAWKNLGSGFVPEAEPQETATIPSATQEPPEAAKVQTRPETPQTTIRSLPDLRRALHSLEGAAASLGFDQIAQTARYCQLDLDLLDSPERSPDARVSMRIRQCFDSLAAFAERESRPGKAHPSAAQPGGAAQDRDTPAPTAAPAATGVRSAKETPPLRETLRKNRILFLVEDDPLQAQDLATQIGYFGYTVRILLSPASLPAALERETPFLILMDVIFPEGPHAGIEAAVHLGNSGRSSPPVIFISRDESMRSRLDAVRSGGKAYLTKPVDVDSLVERIDAIAFPGEAKSAKILIVDDSRVHATFVALQLRTAGMITEILTEPMVLIEHILDFDPDLVLMDMYMPDCTGAELAAVVRQMDRFLGLPIVFLSGEGDRDIQLYAIGHGADDFLTKPVQANHLISLVAAKVGRYRQMRAQMVYDGLTGVLNHSSIMDRLDREVDRAYTQRNAHPEGTFPHLCFAMIDLDDFKSVNDRYGHTAGDRVLCSLTHLLRTRLRGSDWTGRYGGDEFAVVLPATDAEEALAILKGITEAFAGIRHKAPSAEFTIGISCGIARLREGSTAASLLEEADAALYAAKHAGRNRVALA